MTPSPPGPSTKSGDWCQSCFFAKKLHTKPARHETHDMRPSQRTSAAGRTAATVHRRIEEGGERVWRLEDFRNLPSSATAQALSRLARDGVIERLSKGLYYRTRETAFGKSRPNPEHLRGLASKGRTVFPSGVAAANLLGLTTQTASRHEIATSALSLPRKLVGRDAIIHARRPEAWAELSDKEAALLDLLRRAGRTSELSPERTVQRTLTMPRALLWTVSGMERSASPAGGNPRPSIVAACRGVCAATGTWWRANLTALSFAILDRAFAWHAGKPKRRSVPATD